MPIQVLQAMLSALVPAAAIYAAKRWRWASFLGPVALCYGVGILFGNALDIDRSFAMNVGGGAVVLALPLLLFSVDVPAWLRSARATILASLIAFMSVGTVATLVGWYFFARVPHASEIAAGLAAVYTGGTPNMVAISKALSWPPELFITVNACDILISGPYYLLLTMFGPRVLGRFLPAPKSQQTADEDVVLAPRRFTKSSAIVGGLLAMLGAGLAVGLAQIFPQHVRDMLVVVLASTFGITLSFMPWIRSLPGTFAIGEYILLMFCVAIGSVSNLHELTNPNPLILAFVVVVFFASQIVQVGLYRLVGIDRNTALMASIGSIYSPAFVAPVAAQLGSKEALFTGVTIGLVGYALALYLGLIVSVLVRTLAGGL